MSFLSQIPQLMSYKGTFFFLLRLTHPVDTHGYLLQGLTGNPVARTQSPPSRLPSVRTAASAHQGGLRVSCTAPQVKVESFTLILQMMRRQTWGKQLGHLYSLEGRLEAILTKACALFTSLHCSQVNGQESTETTARKCRLDQGQSRPLQLSSKEQFSEKVKPEQKNPP